MQTIPKAKTPVDHEIDILFKELRLHDINSKEYATVLDRIVKLHELQVNETPKRVSRDTLVLAAANLLGIVMVLKHEQLNVITTKAMSLVPRPR